MVYQKLASAIYNDIVSGLRGYHQTPTMSIEQLEDDIVDERLLIMKEYSLRGLLPKKDLLLSINCIPVDCESLDRCRCPANDDPCNELVAHFELPQVALDYDDAAIEYIGTTDRQSSFRIYTQPTMLKYNKHRKRAKREPFIWVDYTPNMNNMLDCFIFNAPLIKQVTAVIIPKDPRQLEQYSCCPSDEIVNFSFINNEIKKRLTEKKIRYYRQLAMPLLPNDQTPQ